MTRQRLSAISLACTLLALAACSTEDVADRRLIPKRSGRTGQGWRARRILADGGHVRGGGARGDEPGSDALLPPRRRQGRRRTRRGWTHHDAGRRESQLDLLSGSGPAPFLNRRARPGAGLEGDGHVPGGGTANLFLYGPIDDVKGVFAPTPMLPSAGNEHITVVNLMRSGQTLEVVTCNDATTCTPISSALALGDVFDAEVPAVFDTCDRSSSTPGSWSGGCFHVSHDRGRRHRVPPRAHGVAPQSTGQRVADLGRNRPMGESANPRSPNLVAAPVFMTEQGQSQFVLF